jgi:RimJ/RimL family protein N-acetyltransferase
MDEGQTKLPRTLATACESVTIRQAAESDAAAYRELRLEALCNHPEAFTYDCDMYKEKPLSYWKERLRELNHENMIFFAVHEARLVGMCGILRGISKKSQHNSLITGMYVQPAWRGQGIADALIQACIDWAQALGATVVRLAVVTTSTSAIRCYKRCGFTEYGIEPQMIYHEGVMYDELLMIRKIGSAQSLNPSSKS